MGRRGKTGRRKRRMGKGGSWERRESDRMNREGEERGREEW